MTEDAKPTFVETEREELGNGRVRLRGRFDFGTALPCPKSQSSMRALAADIASAMAADTVHRGGSLTITMDGDVIEIEARGPTVKEPTP